MTHADVGVHHIDEFWLVARNTAKLEAIAADLRTPARAVSADLSKQEDIDRIEADLGEANGVVTYLVNWCGLRQVRIVERYRQRRCNRDDRS